MKSFMWTWGLALFFILAFILGRSLNFKLHYRDEGELEQLTSRVEEVLNVVGDKAPAADEKTVLIIGRSTSILSIHPDGIHDTDLIYENFLRENCESRAKKCYVYNLSSVALNDIRGLIKTIEMAKRKISKIDYLVLENLGFLFDEGSLSTMELLKITVEEMFDILVNIDLEVLLNSAPKDHASHLCIQKSLAAISERISKNVDLNKSDFLRALNCSVNTKEREDILHSIFKEQMPFSSVLALREAMKDMGLDYDRLFKKLGLIDYNKVDISLMTFGLQRLRQVYRGKVILLTSPLRPLNQNLELLLAKRTGHEIINVNRMINQFPGPRSMSLLFPDIFHYNPWIHEQMARELAQMIDH